MRGNYYFDINIKINYLHIKQYFMICRGLRIQKNTVCNFICFDRRFCNLNYKFEVTYVSDLKRLLTK